ncbi:MAG TPA: radical SAM protein, partial [bacterium]|nr:radical SAM protein [bacterium]
RCAYCLVSRIRGPLVSRAPEQVRAEVDRLAGAGYREAVLCAVNLGAYGLDRGSRLVELLRLLAEPAGRPEGFGLRLSSIEPDRLTVELLETLAAGRLFRRHLHLPFQSGSDRILAAMGRRYRRGEYQRLVDLARRLIPGLFLSTDVMTGFPGESEADFEATLDLLRDISFNRVHIFRFSPRPGTPAAEWPDQVPEPVKSKRARRLKEQVRMEPVAAD